MLAALGLRCRRWRRLAGATAPTPRPPCAPPARPPAAPLHAQVEGTLACRPNAKNPRDLDINISYSWKGKHGEAARSQEYRMR